MGRILISTASFAKDKPDLIERLRSSGHEIVLNSYGRTLKPAEVMDLAADADGIIAGTETYDAGILGHLEKLKVISRVGVGLDSIDLAAARKAGVLIFNTPGGPTQAVAELTVGLMLDLLRKVTVMDRGIRQKQWKKLMGNLLAGKKTGIIGLGRIGRRVADILRVFQADLAYFDVTDVSYPTAKRMKLDELLSWADVVTLHCSGGQGGPVLGAGELAKMKRGAWLINVARGGLIDERELYRKLTAGELSGAALDVFSAEPYEGELVSLDNVILTPHIGSYARESRIQMETEAVENLLEGLRK